jgi:hypothetical protein
MYTGTENFISRLTPEILVNGVDPVKFRAMKEISVILKSIEADAKNGFP